MTPPVAVYVSGALLALLVVVRLLAFGVQRAHAAFRARRASAAAPEEPAHPPVVELPRPHEREHDAFVDGPRCRACGERATKPLVRVVVRELLGGPTVAVALPMPLEDRALCADHWRGALERAKRFAHAHEARALARARRVHREAVEFNGATIDALAREGRREVVPIAKARRSGR